MHFDRLDEGYAMVKSNLNFGKVTLTGLTGMHTGQTGTPSHANFGHQHMSPYFLAKIACQKILFWTKII